MKRAFNADEPELMDRPQPVTRELETDLENLQQINRRFGSYGLVRHFLRGWIKPGRTWRVLDLATGAGDIPRMMADWARALGIALKIDAVDIHPAILEIAKRSSAKYPEIAFIRADALKYSEPL